MKSRDENWQNTAYKNETLHAVDAKFEAQKIAFAPFVFQAARSLVKLGILEEISRFGDKGITEEALCSSLSLDGYAVKILLEMGLSMNVVKISGNGMPHYSLGKIGFFLLNDTMTRVNMDFMHDVCYQGNFFLEESLKEGKPKGLKVFGNWSTIYEGLAELPDKAKHSWFAFDHYYSDTAFPHALKFVFSKKHKHLMDIGGNTAKWAIACMRHDPDVKVTIVDLPGQTVMASRKIEAAAYSDRISLYEANVLDKEAVLPEACDAVWMSQFLDCFSLDEITSILEKVHNAIDSDCSVYVMEPLWDRQRFPAASYSLHATSLYFSCMANGNSKMYGFQELKNAVERAGFRMINENHRIGPNDYSILEFCKEER